jgi:hypothetical protein
MVQDARSSNIIRLLEQAVVEERGKRFAHLLFPFYRQGTLQNRIDQLSASRTWMEEREWIQLARGIIHALHVFHNRPEPLAFRDLKVDFVLAVLYHGC